MSLMLLSLALLVGLIAGFVLGITLRRAADRRPPLVPLTQNTRTGALLAESPVYHFDLGVVHSPGLPVHTIVADDGTVHCETTNGVEAVEAMERLEQGDLVSSITFRTNGVLRKRVVVVT